MRSILQPGELLTRIEIDTEEEIQTRHHLCCLRSSQTLNRGSAYELDSLRILSVEVWSNFGAAQGALETHKRNRSNDLD
jgi:hypothetical protein